MRVLHAYFAVEAVELRLWGEDGARAAPAGTRGRRARVRAHPFALPTGGLRDLAAGGLGPAARTATREWTGVLLLPSARHAPLASPWLAGPAAEPALEALELAAWKVPALAVAPAAAGDLLAALVDDAPDDVELADSVRYLAAVADLARDLVARGRLLPTLVADGGAYAARWQPALAGVDRDERRALLAGMPAAVRAAERRSDVPEDAEALLDVALEALVDGAARRRLGALPRPPRPPAGAVHEAWLRALATPDASVRGDAAVLGSLAEDLEAWEAEHAERQAAVRTAFRLEPPLDDDEPWRVEILLQARDDASQLAPASVVWEAGSAPLEVFGQHVQGPEERLLADLGRAVRLFPALGPALRAPRPEAVELDAAGAYAFMRDDAPLLEACGFGVLLPAWWGRPSTRLGVRLRAAPREDGPATGLLGLEGICDVRWEVVLAGSGVTLDELRELSRTGTPLVRLRGQWVEVDPLELARAERVLAGAGETLELPAREVLRTVAAATADDDDELPIVDVQASGWLGVLLEGGEGTIETVEDPSALHGELRPYQRRGLAWLDFLGHRQLGACLADDMGLGKTVQLLALLLREREAATAAGPTLLVCPMSLIENWRHEAARFAPSLHVAAHHGPERPRGAAAVAAYADADLVLTTYALVARDRTELAGVRFARVVLDEAQAVKNPASAASRAVRSMTAPARVALTGTPVENRLTDLWAIMEFLNPGLLGSAAGFRRRFATPIERYGDEDAAALLARLTRPFLLRRLKTDPAIAQELPEKVEMPVYAPLTTEQASLYAAAVDEMLARVEDARGIERRGLVLATLTRLKQICDHPALLSGDRTGLGGRSGKLELLEELLDEVLEAGERALVFTQYAEMAKLLHDHLVRRLGQEVLLLHGGVDRAGRDEMVQRFARPDGPSVFVLSLRAGGTGLNLVAANHVIHFDRWWNPAVEQQATDRAFRIGQTRDVQVRKLICTGTVEDRIDQLIEQKRALADRIVGGGEGWLAELTNDELRSLVALAADGTLEPEEAA